MNTAPANTFKALPHIVHSSENLSSMKVHTESVQFKVDKKLQDLIEAKMTKLAQYFNRIVQADVVLRLENSGQVRDKIAEVRLKVPGQVLFAKESQKTFELAVTKATDQLRRQLKRYKEKLRDRKDVAA